MKPDAQDSQGSGCIGRAPVVEKLNGVDGKDEGLGSAASPGGGLTEASALSSPRWG